MKKEYFWVKCIKPMTGQWVEVDCDGTFYEDMDFIKDEKLLKQLAFNEGTLIDFWESSDIEKFFEKTKNVSNKTATVDEYLNGIKGGLL